jgi:hypothetical protein
MILYIYVILNIAMLLYMLPHPNLAPNIETGGVLTWFTVELWAWYGIIISNCLFQCVRAFTGKLPLDTAKGVADFNRLPTLDSILAMNDIAVSFHTECVPCVVSSFLNYSRLSFQSNNNTKEAFQLKIILVSQYIALVCVSILIFRTWKTGPDWWVRNAPKLYFCLLMIVYLILPSLNILVEICAAIAPKII